VYYQPHFQGLFWLTNLNAIGLLIKPTNLICLTTITVVECSRGIIKNVKLMRIRWHFGLTIIPSRILFSRSYRTIIDIFRNTSIQLVRSSTTRVLLARLSMSSCDIKGLGKWFKLSKASEINIYFYGLSLVSCVFFQQKKLRRTEAFFSSVKPNTCIP